MVRKLKGKSAQATGMLSYNSRDDQFTFSNGSERQVGGARKRRLHAMRIKRRDCLYRCTAFSTRLSGCMGKERKATEEKKEKINQIYEGRRAFKNIPHVSKN